MRLSSVLSMLAVCCLVSSGFLWAAARPTGGVSTYIDKTYGFSMNAPQFPKAAAGTQTSPIMMLAPPEDGFANNVNVIIQPASVSRKAYRDLSAKQFEAIGYKLNSEQNLTVSGRDALLLDYEGEQQGRLMRFRALAVIDKDRILLVTATAPKSSYSKYEAAFRACLESFKVEP